MMTGTLQKSLHYLKLGCDEAVCAGQTRIYTSVHTSVLFAVSGSYGFDMFRHGTHPGPSPQGSGAERTESEV